MFTTANRNSKNKNSKKSFTTVFAAAAYLIVTSTGIDGTQNINSKDLSSFDWVVAEEKKTTNKNNVSSQDMVKVILSKFGLAVKDFESILEIKRAAIYNWKKGANEPNQTQYVRIKSLYEVALKLSDFSGRIGRMSKTHLYQGMSFVDRLNQKNIDINEAVEHHNVLVKKLANQHLILAEHGIKNINFPDDRVASPEGHV